MGEEHAPTDQNGRNWFLRPALNRERADMPFSKTRERRRDPLDFPSFTSALSVKVGASLDAPFRHGGAPSASVPG
jgi:hypothetical protein